MEKEIERFFSGIGEFRGRKDYTDAERIVLSHFFTNLESNVYCATDNMPTELWALLMGQYARSNLTAKDRLLQLFADVKEKDKTGKVPSLEKIARMIEGGSNISDALEIHLKRAGNFVEMFGVRYGHASLRDSGVIRICFEGVSQRVTKFLEAAREGAYQEQSTRAIPFLSENLGVPFEIRGTEYETRVLELDKKLINLYEEIRKKLPLYLKVRCQHLRNEADEQIAGAVGDKNSKLPDALWEKVVNEKTFDIARFLLPQNMTTSLGMTLNTRRFMDMLTEWQSSPFTEMQELGRAAQIESMEIFPTLMKYGNPSEFYSQLPGRRRELFSRLVPGRNLEYKHHPIESKLIAVTPGIEDFVLASILFNGSDGNYPFDELRKIAESLTPEKRREIAKSQFEGKMGFELISKVMEVGSFIFERTYDIGGFRDLQRQRGDRQQTAPYSVFGFHMPKEIGEIGLEKEFVHLMYEVKELHDELRTKHFHEAAEYVPVMANLVRHVVTMDPVQAFYQAKLRTQPAGAETYRGIARQEIKQVLELMPSFKGFVEFDNNDYVLNRLPEAVNGVIERLSKKN
ncbi:MAG: FAD-dependent thymidylate synthase [Nanoarchaeota archaeon]